MTMRFTEPELTGITRSHVIQLDNPRFAAHSDVVKAFLEMRNAAKKDGIEIEPFSSYRNLKTQIRIWNKKFSGQKPLFDINGNIRDYSKLDKNEIIDAILGWSALPGASRHHWGTEIDVVDGSAMPENYHIKLLPEEVNPNGLFFSLHCWLDQNMSKFGFFRPYKIYQGGMFPEPWHLSYEPISSIAQKVYSIDIARRVIENNNILGKELLLQRLPEIFEQHIYNICCSN